MNMVELVEIYTKSSEYDPELKNVRSEYGLRKVFVNPSCVVYMRENDSFKLSRAAGSLSLSELDERTRFTKISFTSQGVNSVVVDVVGSPDDICKKFSEL